MEISMEAPQKNLKIELPYDPAVSLLAIYSRESRSAYTRSTRTPMFIVALFAITKIWSQPSVH
jgi:hypothetical protein